MEENQKNKSRQEIGDAFFSPWRVFCFEGILFSLGLGLGILAGLRLQEIFKMQKVSPPPISLWQFSFYFLFATFFLLLIIYFLKFKKGKGLFLKGLFIIAVAFGNLLFFGLWFPDILTFLIVGLLLFLLLKKTSLITNNLAVIFAIAGIGAGLGLRFTPEMVVLLLLIFSIYDFIAVYKTKHMVKMAEEMIAQRAILGLVIPQKIADFTAPLKEVKPGGKFLILGGGDIVFPLILAVSLIPQGILSSLIVAGFSLVGLFAGFLIFISRKIRAPMPALPPIALFAIIGYLITKVLSP